MIDFDKALAFYFAGNKLRGFSLLILPFFVFLGILAAFGASSFVYFLLYPVCHAFAYAVDRVLFSKYKNIAPHKLDNAVTHWRMGDTVRVDGEMLPWVFEGFVGKYKVRLRKPKSKDLGEDVSDWKTAQFVVQLQRVRGRYENFGTETNSGVLWLVDWHRHSFRNESAEKRLESLRYQTETNEDHSYQQFLETKAEAEKEIAIESHKQKTRL